MYYGLISIMPKFAYDPDAQAFITAAGITDATQKSAINQLVLDLKFYSLWASLHAIYPFVGGTATTHKFNLKNALDTDAAFRLLFSGGFTHNANGVTGNGSNAWADTFLTPSTHLTNNSLSIGFYSLLNTGGNVTEMGCSSSGLANIIGLSVRLTADLSLFDAYDFTGHRILTANTNSLGLFVGTVENSTTQKLYQNGTQIGSTISTAQTVIQPTTSMALFGRNDSGSIVNFSGRICPFAFIGDGLNSTQVANMTTAINTFNTTLGR